MKRWKTSEVAIGKVMVGGDNPIRIQSMTTSDTRDVKATILQVKRLADAGCEIARVTVQGKKEAEACEAIKNGLIRDGYDIPLVADIHFYPPAAMLVAEFVDKVRVNPGNYVDKRAIFKQIDYTDASYADELAKIEEGFSPLVKKCKERGIAMRIGTNHGSLSDRIMSRYGDTPNGMVESALEFARVCRLHNYHNFLFSMKASNPIVMIEAYRRLVQEMSKLSWNYPLHLGVTEAGDGEDGRVKSAMGIGSLLLDGLGDTIRISLTEDPWYEIDPCKRLISFIEQYPDSEPRCDRTRTTRIKKKVEPPLHPDGSVILYEERHQPDIFVLAPVATARDIVADQPVILYGSYDVPEEDVVIQAAAELGALLADGIGDGICIHAPQMSKEKREQLSFTILQAARMRHIRTEFIACPGCGRTLFDLQSVTQRIRKATGHLPGVKIAIMGCIVNGPGEMADADFGYVGAGRGKIDLYVGKTCVERGIASADAEGKLIDLIKAHGRWLEKENGEPLEAPQEVCV